MGSKYDYTGMATRNDLKCSDGRIIRRGAFADQDGEIVPVVWNHDHNDPFSVLGHALLKNQDDGVRAYIKFNDDTEQGRNAKALVKHGDVKALSIYANKLKQRGSDVMHGTIRELSLVLAGANPGAYIDDVVFAHGEDADGEAIIYSGSAEFEIWHSEDDELEHADKKKKDEDEKASESENSDNKEEKNVATEEKKKAPEAEEGEKGGKTIEQVFNTLNDEQKDAVYAMVGMAIEDAKGSKNSEEDEKMKHNAFDNDTTNQQDYICHADQMEILNLAKNSTVGSFQEALGIYAEDNNMTDVLQHDATASGFRADNIDLLFPEYKDVRPGAPELITNDQGWISTVMNKVHKSPISRIRTGQVDIRGIEALRAKGYQKGKQKKLTGNFKLVRRTTDPQTVYVKNALHRDDIIDITDFDYVQYLYNIDKMMLNEELATAIMFGDGREDGDADKIYPEHIRPIYLDDDLYTMHKEFKPSEIRAEFEGSQQFGDNYVWSEGMVNTVLYAREDFKGTGTPDAYMTPHTLNRMLLARDLNGRRLYSSKSELAAALNVGEIYTIEQMASKSRTDEDSGKTFKPLIIIGNLADYSLGSTKGGEITHFTQFDIDFNQEKSLIETRVSGAITRVYSFIAIEQDASTVSPSSSIAPIGGNG